jgi:hypothetical protein
MRICVFLHGLGLRLLEEGIGLHFILFLRVTVEEECLRVVKGPFGDGVSEFPTVSNSDFRLFTRHRESATGRTSQWGTPCEDDLPFKQGHVSSTPQPQQYWPAPSRDLYCVSMDNW